SSSSWSTARSRRPWTASGSSGTRSPGSPKTSARPPFSCLSYSWAPSGCSYYSAVERILMRIVKALGLCLLACVASVGESRDPPAASTTAVQQPPPAQQGPSQPLPSQAPPAPPPGAGQQAVQMAQQAAAVEGNP